MDNARISLVAAALAATTACVGSIMPLYEEARSEALADPGVAEPGWQPDAVLHLTEPLLADVVRVVLDEHGTLSEPVEIRALAATVTPALEVERVKITSTDRCEDCLTVRAALAGDLEWKLARRSGTVDLRATTTFDVELVAEQEGYEWTVELRPHELRKVSVELGRLAGGLGKVAGGAVEDWLEARLLARVPSYELGPFGAEEVPLRGLRVIPAGTGVRVAMLTASPSPTPVAVRDSKQRDGWQLDISQGSLLDLARRAAFEHGAVSYDVVTEPTALDMGRGEFTLGLRLWRPKGKGWWRDYTVAGLVDVTDRSRLKLTPTEVEEGEKSPGAAMADPIALLGEGYILSTIEQSVATSLPVRQGTELGGTAVDLSVDEVWGTGGTLTLVGSLGVGEPEATRERPEGSSGTRTRPR